MTEEWGTECVCLDDGPPLWALDEAARRCGYAGWKEFNLMLGGEGLRGVVRELAKEIARNNPPPDPDAREREECARLLDALGKPATADHLRSGDGSPWNKSDAMIAELKTILKERGL